MENIEKFLEDKKVFGVMKIWRFFLTVAGIRIKKKGLKYLFVKI